MRSVVDVSLDIEPGQTVALTGRSGAGKSSLLHLIGGMDRPTRGEIVVRGVEVHALTERSAPRFRRTVGMVFQQYNLLGHLNALDNVVLPHLGARLGRAEWAQARELLGAVGLDAARAEPTATLSGGEQQRVAVARALFGRPRLVLADEPTGALDSRQGSEVIELLTRLQRDRGFTLIVATHAPEVAAHCLRRIELLDGAVVKDSMFEQLDHRRLLRRMNAQA